jgi:hypothetical protein
MPSAGPVRAFYAHADRQVVEALRDHLGWLENDERIAVFDDSRLVAGEVWEERLKAELRKADIILLVITAKFIRSSYCTKVELKEALHRREADGTCVIPILAATCDWEPMPVSTLQALPKDTHRQLKPLNRWGKNIDVALTQIAKQVRANVDAIVAGRSGTPDDQPISPKPSPQAHGDVRWRLPDEPDRCFGRDRDTATLVAALTAGQPLKTVVVFGGPGMGKSTLTRTAVCHVEVVGRFGDRRAWVALDKAADPEAVVAAVHDALDLPPETDPWRGIEAATRAGPALLVLDNLETPWEHDQTGTENVLARLARLRPLALLASIRSGHPPSRPAWGTSLEVHRLMAPHDRNLLCAIASDIASDDPLLPDVLAALDGWPLAIELFAAQAMGFGSLRPAWQRWQTERAAMLDRGEAEPDRLTSLAVSLGFSLDSPRMMLKPPHRADAPGRLYVMLGRLPDGLALGNAESLLPGDGDAAAKCLVRMRLARLEGICCVVESGHKG